MQAEYTTLADYGTDEFVEKRSRFIGYAKPVTTEEEAIRAATFNPAKAIGAADKVGTIETGKLADFVVTNADYTQKRVFIGGKEI